MPSSALKSPRSRPAAVPHDGRRYPLIFENGAWRLRSRSKAHPADYRTGTSNLKLAKERAKAWLAEHANDLPRGRKGGGTLEQLQKLYVAMPKRTQKHVAEINVSRLRTICRLALGKELPDVTCREVSPDLWRKYQEASLAAAGRTFDLVTRYRENIGINSAIRAARCCFLPAMIRHYRASGLDVRGDCASVVMLPVPYIPPVEIDDASLVAAWGELADLDPRLWLVIGLARFAGLRREEIAQLRGGWIEERDGVVSIALRDRPEENWWTKTGKPYRAEVIEPDLADHLRALRDFEPEKFVVPEPPQGDDRARWFEREPQRWLRAHGVKAQKPLHRLRGAYAEAVARLTKDAVTARLAAIRAAQASLGHTTTTTTENHYLSADALR